jgi:hypothetical protein
MAADKFIAAEERKVGERYGYVPKLHPSEYMGEPAQEPYGYVSYDERMVFQKDTPEIGRWIRVYTTPPKRPWVGLNDADFCRQINTDDFLAGAFFAETKLKEKNNG